jgi:hypothetical protein
MLLVRPGVLKADCRGAASGAWGGGGCPAAAARQPQAVRQGPEQRVAGMHPVGQGVFRAARQARMQGRQGCATKVKTAQGGVSVRHVWARGWWQEPTATGVLTAAGELNASSVAE